jgi:very-short-patch-repair endonuclease
MTPSEKALQKLLRSIEGAHFRKQAPVGDYVFDFGWLSAGILIEIDGAIHALPDVQARDKAKTIFAITQGFRVVRIQNGDVRDRPAWVVEQVREAIAHRASVRPPPLTPPHEGAGDEEERDA